MLLEMTSDEQLVQSYLAGDDAAFGELVLRYMPRLTAYASRFSREGAEDIAQDALFKAWKSLSLFDTSMSFRAWIMKITKNTALDRAKKKKETVFSALASDAELMAIEDTSPLPSDLAVSGEKCRQVAAALKNLPEPYRAVVALRYEEDRSFDDIAAFLGKPLNTVRSQHQRALKILRPYFDSLSFEA